MLAAGIVQATFAGKLEKVSEGGEVETTGGYIYHRAGNSSRFVAIEFLSQNTQTLILTCACVLETLVRSDIAIIGERAKRARLSQVCSIENRGYIY